MRNRTIGTGISARAVLHPRETYIPGQYEAFFPIRPTNAALLGDPALHIKHGAAPISEVDHAAGALAFELNQNYPNPFNPATAISYRLSAVGRVTLKVYDMLGRKVATLADGRQTAGLHVVTFDAGSLPSGVYFYRLRAGAHTQSRKLMLLK